MLRMVSHPRRPQSGQITCYLNRTYHVLPTLQNNSLDWVAAYGYPARDTECWFLLRSTRAKAPWFWITLNPATKIKWD